MMIFIAIFAALLPMIPVMAFFVRSRMAPLSPALETKRLARGLTRANIVIGLLVAGLAAVWLFSPQTVRAAALAADASADGLRYLAAGIAVGLGSIGAGYAVSSTGAAAVGAITEKPEAFGRALIFVGLAEGVAIYGLIIAFIVLGA